MDMVYALGAWYMLYGHVFLLEKNIWLWKRTSRWISLDSCLPKKQAIDNEGEAIALMLRLVFVFVLFVFVVQNF